MQRPIHRPIYRAIASSLLTRPGGFNPMSLFNDGSIGVLYDNNDLTTMFLDAAGTTPATVNGLVGLQLDKSQGLVLGAELSANTYSRNNTVESGTSGFPCVCTSTGAFSVVGINIATGVVAGKWYKVSISWSNNTSGRTVKIFSGSAGFNCGTAVAGTATGYVLAGIANMYYYIDTSAGGQTFTIDSLQLIELPGNHRYQTTTGSKPILRGTPTGGNLVTNGDFASGTAGWSALNATLSASGGGGIRITNTAGGQSSAGRSFATTIGKVYRVTGTLTTQGTGTTCWLYLGTGLGAGDIGGIQWPPATTGTKVFYFTATTTTTWINPSCGTPALAGEYHEWDNIEVKDVSAGSVTAPYGLQYDGVDDFLQTASVNFSATDKMFVCAGVRKLSDAARGIVVELGTDPAVQNGVFWFDAPLDATNKFRFGNKGTSIVTPLSQSATFNAPVSVVASCIGDISGDNATLRLNGSVAQTLTTDQGAGNYGNYAIYFGRRAGTSNPLNGLDFGCVIVGKTLTAAQISSTERWMAQRTGVSI